MAQLKWSLGAQNDVSFSRSDNFSPYLVGDTIRRNLEQPFRAWPEHAFTAQEVIKFRNRHLETQQDFLRFGPMLQHDSLLAIMQQSSSRQPAPAGSGHYTWPFIQHTLQRRKFVKQRCKIGDFEKN